jgi:predicted enzyme related to lactoylglutathione lyase
MSSRFYQLVIDSHDPHAPEGRTVKNRLHIDLNPDDRDAEVERLLALGATRADVGQSPEVTWVVLADPEGNEFCVVRRHETLAD